MLAHLRTALRIVGTLELAAAAAVLAAIALIILSQVFSRYVMGTPLIWAEEMATYLLIWLGFLAASVAYKLRRHIAIKTYESFAPPTLKRVANALIHVLIVIALVVVIVHIPDAMRTERMQSTVGLPVSLGLHWFFTVPTLVACASMAITALFYTVDTLVGSGKPILATLADPSLTDDIIKDDNPKPMVS